MENKTTTPKDIISGYFIKNGYVLLNDVNAEQKKQTIIVNYGESGRRGLNLGYTIEITLQLISAQTGDVLCVGSAEGQGSTETADIRIAINRCLKAIFQDK